MSSVSLVRIERNNVNSMKEAIIESLRLIEYDFKEIKNVIIKPNLCYYWDYSTGQTTDPRFIGALIEVLRERIAPDVHISIVESDASAMKCKHVFRMLGYEKLASKYEVELVNLSEDKSEKIDAEVGGHTFHLMLPRTIRDAELKINVPKIKYMSENIKLTCALKNIFGCNPYPRKFKFHPHLEETIVAVNKIMNFDLCVVDGNIVSGAQTRRLGLVMTGRDPVAIDTAAARIASLNPKSIRHLQLARKEGLGNMAFIQKGESIRYFKDRYPKTTVRQKVVEKAFGILTRTGIGSTIGLG